MSPFINKNAQHAEPPNFPPPSNELLILPEKRPRNDPTPQGDEEILKSWKILLVAAGISFAIAIGGMFFAMMQWLGA